MSAALKVFKRVLIASLKQQVVRGYMPAQGLLNMTPGCAAIYFQECKSFPPVASLTLFREDHFTCSSQNLTIYQQQSVKVKKLHLRRYRPKCIIHLIIDYSWENPDASSDVDTISIYEERESQEPETDEQRHPASAD